MGSVGPVARPGLLVHPKFRRLTLTLGLPEPHVYGLLEFIWRVGYENGDPLLGDATDVELAAGWTGTPGKLVEALLACRFIDQGERGFEIHDLFDHAPAYVQRRMEAEFQRQAKGKTISDIRREAARARWDKKRCKTDAKRCKCKPVASSIDANAS